MPPRTPASLADSSPTSNSARALRPGAPTVTGQPVRVDNHNRLADGPARQVPTTNSAAATIGRTDALVGKTRRVVGGGPAPRLSRASRRNHARRPQGGARTPARLGNEDVPWPCGLKQTPPLRRLCRQPGASGEPRGDVWGPNRHVIDAVCSFARRLRTWTFQSVLTPSSSRIPRMFTTSSEWQPMRSTGWRPWKHHTKPSQDSS